VLHGISVLVSMTAQRVSSSPGKSRQSPPARPLRCGRLGLRSTKHTCVRKSLTHGAWCAGPGCDAWQRSQLCSNWLHPSQTHSRRFLTCCNELLDQCRLPLQAVNTEALVSVCLLQEAASHTISAGVTTHTATASLHFQTPTLKKQITPSWCAASTGAP
jgi:hypothetical protein